MKVLRIIILLALTNINNLSAQQKAFEFENQSVTYVTGKVDDNLKHDTLSMVLQGPFLVDGSPERFSTRTLTATVDANGEFKFEILTGNLPFHFSLFLSSKRDSRFGNLSGDGDIANYLIEAGDSIHVVFKKQSQYYTGKGSSLFEAQYASNRIMQLDSNEKNCLTTDSHDYIHSNIEKWLRQKDSILNVQLDVLSGYKSILSPFAYSIVRADIIGLNRSFVYRIVGLQGLFFTPGKKMEPGLANAYKELTQRSDYFSGNDKANLSPEYINYLYLKIRLGVIYDRISQNENISIYDRNYFPAITKQYAGTLRDKLLAYWLIQLTGKNDLQPEYLENALAVMQSAYFKSIVEQLKNTYARGEPVKDFDFKDVNGKTVHLADFKGKVVFVDMWFSGCSGCVHVAAALPHVEEVFRDRADVVFVSLCIDEDRNLWIKSIDKNLVGKHYTHYTTSTTKYLYTAGTGPNNPFIKAYVPDGSYPSLLIIDKEGKLFSSTPIRPDVENGEPLIKEINGALQVK
ncbi:TlpA disulfide reductase family protein [Mucilaginibacter sp. L196]|uniref:TlpA family protein disulfide reductase n=1 Tax=Mucilaginibacter sp. L196 TaxID=1641870 RepID=UPI00131C3AF6|nr:TlpA disulfide reductase family protein [Mucilaginibacter sp. L196]